VPSNTSLSQPAIRFRHSSLALFLLLPALGNANITQSEIIDQSVGGVRDCQRVDGWFHALQRQGSFNECIQVGRKPGDVGKLLVDLPVSVSQTNVQQTSIDTAKGYLYTVNIEPGPRGDVAGSDLLTVVRQGRQMPNRTWQWQSAIVDNRTVYDRWHSAPSVAIDKAGYVHVAYNMHNFPWQYKRSKYPFDIYNFDFKGQEFSDSQIEQAVTLNRTFLPTLGTADIPGNQITYPAFFKDVNEDLYVSYRFAAAPKRNFSERYMSSGVAVYDTATTTWTSIGGNVNHWDGDFEWHADAPSQAVSFAGERGWTSYLPKLVFDQQNNMIVSVMWRQGIAGAFVTMPCIMRTSDRVNATDFSGQHMPMPITPDNCSNVGISNDQQFNTIGSFAISNQDVPYMLLSPSSGKRFIVRYSAADNQWIREAAPDSTVEIFFDNNDALYAVASGIKIYKRDNPSSEWNMIYDEGQTTNCFPHVKKDQSGRTAFIHTQSCDQSRVTIYGLRLHW